MSITTPNYQGTFTNASVKVGSYISLNLTQANTTFVNVTGALLDISTNTFASGSNIGSNYTVNRTETTVFNSSDRASLGFTNNRSISIVNNSNQTLLGNNSSELIQLNYTFNNRTEAVNNSEGAQYVGTVITATEQYFLSTSPTGSNTTVTNSSMLNFDGNKTVVNVDNSYNTISISEATRNLRVRS